MCKPISLIITEDKVFFPPDNVWNHSHSFIMEIHNIPDGLIGDKYLRLEVVPPEYNVFRNKKTNEKLEVNDDWKVVVDEENIPDWYSTDKPNQEYRAREAVNKWFQNFPDNLVPGYRKIAGDYSTLTGGDDSKLTGGYCSKLTGGDESALNAGKGSTLTGGDYSILTGEDCSILTGEYRSTLNAGKGSTLTGGNYSTLTGGENSTLTAYNDSIFYAGEGSEFILHWFDENRKRTTVAYVGENGIEPNKKYRGIDGKFIEIK